MACAPAFDGSIPFDCVRELVADVISGNPLGTDKWTQLQKIAHVIGCVGKMLEGKPDPVPVFGAGEGPQTLQAVAQAIDVELNAIATAPGAFGAGWKPDPERLKRLLDLLIKYAPLILPLFI